MTNRDDAISNRMFKSLMCEGLSDLENFQHLDCSYKIQHASKRSHSFELHGME
jgi:hypothetical protein